MRLLQNNTFLRLIFYVLMLALAGAAVTASAQPATAPADTGPASEGDDGKQKIENLITTLESETARNELIAELRTLLEATGDKAEEPVDELEDALVIDERAQAWKEQYIAFLEKYGLNASLVGYTLASLAILIVAFVLIKFVRKLINLVYRRISPLVMRYHLSRRRMAFYISTLRLWSAIIIMLVAVAALAALWGIEFDDWIPEYVQLFVLQAVISIITVCLIAAVTIEVANIAVEHFFRQKFSHQSARMNTLLPIAQTVLLLTLFTLFGLTLLSQLGLNVMPLLAGAGVVGFAVGFGAQTLIKDVLTGFIIIIEDLVQVGDVATLGGKSGLVERITIRKVQLRDLDGTVFTVPFSEVSIVANLTKDFSYYLINLRVAYREDTDRVVALLKEIDAGMREEDEYKDEILEPIEVLGVDSFGDSAVIIKARIKTKPIQQWTIGREFNRRMKQVFDEHNIEIPFPHRTLYFGQDKDGTAPPMLMKKLRDQGSANEPLEKEDPAG